MPFLVHMFCATLFRYQGNSNYCEMLSFEILTHCNGGNPAVRAKATALFYLLLKVTSKFFFPIRPKCSTIAILSQITCFTEKLGRTRSWRWSESVPYESAGYSCRISVDRRGYWRSGAGNLRVLSWTLIWQWYGLDLSRIWVSCRVLSSSYKFIARKRRRIHTLQDVMAVLCIRKCGN